jgi:hypothetical protein
MRFFGKLYGLGVYEDIRILNAEEKDGIWFATLSKNITLSQLEESVWIIEKYGPREEVFTGIIDSYIPSPYYQDQVIGIRTLKPTGVENWDEWINRRIEYEDPMNNRFACYYIKTVTEATIDGVVKWEIIFDGGWQFQTYFAVGDSFTIYKQNPDYDQEHQQENNNDGLDMSEGFTVGIIQGLMGIKINELDYTTFTVNNSHQIYNVTKFFQYADAIYMWDMGPGYGTFTEKSTVFIELTEDGVVAEFFIISNLTLSGTFINHPGAEMRMEFILSYYKTLNGYTRPPPPVNIFEPLPPLFSSSMIGGTMILFVMGIGIGIMKEKIQKKSGILPDKTQSQSVNTEPMVGATGGIGHE